MSEWAGCSTDRGRYDPACLVIAVAVILVAVWLPAEFWPMHGVLAVGMFAALTVARVPLQYLVRRLTLFLPAVGALAFTIPLVHGFHGGWELAFSILFRATVSFLAALWLICVVPFPRVLSMLAALRVPSVLVVMLAFMYRYIAVLWDELHRMRTARRARLSDHVRPLARWSAAARLAGMLLIRSMGRAERIHAAMQARGWNGRLDLVHRDHQFTGIRGPHR